MNRLNYGRQTLLVMNKRILICFAAFFVAAVCFGQEKADAKESLQLSDFYAQFDLAAGVKKHDVFNPMISLGYTLQPRTSLFWRGSFVALKLEGKEDGVTPTRFTGDMGLGISYDLLSGKKSTEGTFLGNVRPHIYIGTTLGNADWRYTLYEGGVEFALRKRCSIVCGFGYRYYDSRGTDNHQGVYVSYGLRL